MTQEEKSKHLGTRGDEGAVDVDGVLQRCGGQLDRWSGDPACKDRFDLYPLPRKTQNLR